MKLFISYSHDDKNYVDALAAALSDEDTQHEVWHDDRLFGGQKWWDKILEEIEACECFIPIITPRSLTSIFCEAELDYARALNKALLPFKLKSCEVPSTLTDSYQVEDIQGKKLDRVVKRTQLALFEIQRRVILGMHESPDPAPPRPTLPTARKTLLAASAERIVDLSQALQEAQSPNTRRIYSRWLRDFLGISRTDERLQVAPDAFADRLKAHGFTNWIKGLTSRGNGRSSVAQARAAVVWAAQLLFDQGLLDADALARLRGTRIDLPNRAGKSQTELSPEQIRRLLRFAGKPHLPQSSLYTRNRAIVLLAVTCGLEREELVTLNWEDIHLGNGAPSLTIRSRRLAKRVIIMPRSVEDIIIQWRACHPIPHPTRPVFTRVFKGNTVSADRLTASTIRIVVADTAKFAGLKDISPQVVRRSFVRAAYSGGVPLEALRDVLGHISLASTERLIGEAERSVSATVDFLDWVNAFVSKETASDRHQSVSRQLTFPDDE